MGLSDLFRMEAINAGKEQAYGSVIIATPLNMKICALFSFFLLIIILVFISTYAYTSRTVISGYLTPDKGLSKIYPSQYGIIRKSFVTEGARVKEGDTLFILSASDTRSIQNRRVPRRKSARKLNVGSVHCSVNWRQ